MAVKIHFFTKYQVGKIMAPGKSREDHSYQISTLFHLYIERISPQKIENCQDWKIKLKKKQDLAKYFGLYLEK